MMDLMIAKTCRKRRVRVALNIERRRRQPDEGVEMDSMAPSNHHPSPSPPPCAFSLHCPPALEADNGKAGFVCGEDLMREGWSRAVEEKVRTRTLDNG